MNRLRIGIFIILLWNSFTHITAQALHNTDAATDFYRGEKMYLDGNHAGCIDIMHSILQRTDAQAWHEEAAFYITMSQALQGGSCVPAILEQYIKKYPATRHRPEIYMTMGNHYFYSNDYSKAIEKYTLIDLGTLKPAMRDDWCHRLAYSFLYNNEDYRALPLFTALAQNSELYCNEARYYEGYIHYNNKRYSEARRSLSQVQSASKFGNEAQYLLVHLDFIDKNYARTIAAGERFLNNIGDTIHINELYRILGESYYMIHNDAKAIEYLGLYISHTDSPIRNTLYMAGILAYRNSNYKDAIKYLSMVTDIDDNLCQNAYLHIGLAYLRLNESRNAALAFEQAANYSHDNFIRETALYNHALCAYESDFSLFDNTIAIFEQFLNEYPYSVHADDINTRLSDLYVNSRNYRTALNSINRIKHPSRQILKAKQQILYLLGTESFANNRIDEAGEWFAESVKVGNYSPEYRARSIYWLGECCYRKHAYNEALKCYNQFLSANTTTDAETVSLAHYNVAYCYFNKEEFNKSLTSFEKFVSRKYISRPLKTDAYNRIGDCYYYARNYIDAEKNYAKAVDMKDAGSEYALMQQAVVSGLNKDNNKKIGLLNKFITLYPESQYTEEVFNEMAQTYIVVNRPQDAISTYHQLVTQFPQSVSARKAMLQLGMLYFNIGNTDNSIASYQQLIITFPSSKEAKVAAEDLKSIYIDRNNIEELTAFMKSQGIKYETSEIDSLTYLAAERSYMKVGETESFERYITQFQEGAFVSTAHYYIGKEAFAASNYDKALDHYTASLQNSPDGEFAEEALARRCEILYMKQQYQEALPAFALLAQKAITEENRLAAQLGLLRVNSRLGHHDAVILAANQLLSDSKLSPELQQEASYSRATAYRLSGNIESALADYRSLAADTRTEYGAESAYRIAQYYYDNNDMAQAEEAANNFIDVGTPHAYWLARNILLLSDIYTAKGDSFMAKQYLKSLQENYPGSNDDITSGIESRLQSINN